jgi:GNAT superfamily N-acetyltransferase
VNKSDKKVDALKQALDYDWPEIQGQLVAESGGGLSLGSWWLDNFDRKHVIMELPGIVIMNSKPWHAENVSYTLRKTYGLGPKEACDDCFEPEDILVHIERFPVGQFMAMRISGPSAGHAIATAITMRTSRPPTAPILPWREAIGDLQLSAHESAGEWLYGVELAVYPMYQGHGIGTALYKARFQLVRQLNLRGWYAVGMLMGYKDYADKMDVVEYGNKVIAREIKDPTVTMQMNRGFRAEHVVENYVDEPAAGDAGVLIVWENPDYQQDYE